MVKDVGQCTWLLTLLGRRSGQMYNDILIHGLRLVVWLDGQGLRRKVIRKLVTKKQQRFQGMSTSEVGHGPGIGHAPWWAKIY